MSSPPKAQHRLPQPLEWLLRDRTTGGVTIAQFPNQALIVFLLATLVRSVIHPHGSAGVVIRLLGGLALTLWAGDELVRGVNPWRRILGATVLIVTAIGLIGLVG